MDCLVQPEAGRESLSRDGEKSLDHAVRLIKTSVLLPAFYKHGVDIYGHMLEIRSATPLCDSCLSKSAFGPKADGVDGSHSRHLAAIIHDDRWV